MVAMTTLINAFKQISKDYRSRQESAGIPITPANEAVIERFENLELNEAFSPFLQQLYLLSMLQVFANPTQKIDRKLIELTLSAINHFSAAHPELSADIRFQKFINDLKNRTQYTPAPLTHKPSRSFSVTSSLTRDSKRNLFSHEVEKTHKDILPGIKVKNREKYRHVWFRKRIVDPEVTPDIELLRSAIANNTLAEDIKDIRTPHVKDFLKEIILHFKGDELKAAVNEIIAQLQETLLKKAIKETVAGEFFRLIKPNQPKKRFNVDKEGEVFVLSKEVKEADALNLIPSATLAARINSDGCVGLGTILVTNLAVNETDAKLGNMFINEEMEIIKIDDDMCLHEVNHPQRARTDAKITTSDLTNLPFVSNYKPNNWLDIYEFKKGIDESGLQHYGPGTNIPPTKNHLIQADFPQKPNFRTEVNETLLKILMLPDELIKKFVHAYTREQTKLSAWNKNIIDTLSMRFTQMRKAALAEPGFRQFLESPNAEICRERIINEIKDFIPSKKTPLIKGDEEHLISAMYTKFNKLRKDLQVNQENRLPRIPSSHQFFKPGITSISEEKKLANTPRTTLPPINKKR